MNSAPCLAAQLGQRLEEAGPGHEHAHVSDHRLDDDRRDVFPSLGEERPRRARVVVGQRQGQGGELLRHARRVRQTERLDAAPRLDQERVAGTVVAALELHQHLAAGERPGHAQGGERRLGAGRGEAHLLHRRHALTDELGQLDLTCVRRSEAGAELGGGGDRLDDGWMGVAEDERAPAAHVVHVAMSVHVGEPGAATLAKEDRRAAHAPKRPDRRVHPAGDDPPGAIEQALAAGRSMPIRSPGSRGPEAAGNSTAAPWP